jgi:DnaJ-class molecular chaperone
MDPLAAVASLAILALAIVTIGYGLACAVAPWGHCRKCHGIGRKTTRRGKVTRSWCRRCDGTGLRVRVGRRVWTWISREYREGNR